MHQRCMPSDFYNICKNQPYQTTERPLTRYKSFIKCDLLHYSVGYSKYYRGCHGDDLILSFSSHLSIACSHNMLVLVTVYEHSLTSLLRSVNRVYWLHHYDNDYQSNHYFYQAMKYPYLYLGLEV